MQALDALTRAARALADGARVSGPAQTEAARQMQICNACRYCEGFCAVFPAMTRRLEFGKADIHFLANLCHDCGACLHACQYAPPHAFAVNVPQAMARVRVQTYTDYAWPPPFGKLYQRNGLTVSLALLLGLALFLFLAMLSQGAPWNVPAGTGFYGIFPHTVLVLLFAPVFLFSTLALGMGVRRFWRDLTPATSGAPLTRSAAVQAADAVLRLKYLDGGHGAGCHNEDDAHTLSRRRLHHCTFYGFLLCFAATSVATLYHYVLGLAAPYDWPSLPKVLGVAGGVSLLVGTAGLGWLNLRRHPLHGDAAQKPMDRGFMALLFFTSASGLALWLCRGTPAMPLVLCLHLAAVMALFATLPYGKFAHGIFRSAALLRHCVEQRQPGKWDAP
ncbi:tricarballylate utilization 4Fe-4S protein TcuB [Verminephrobacter aporrectodeae subsp. tuberculatae]|uniref:tricarballylate utilization 4Fe-4S protein TcuB n=1 Tax=Verminephrobacter aporrectodeae TaxID=1110389 RepID=UPI002ADDE8A2|nr:tricarballylate utilization 4Fe-4S protein TcuB [Verminephrobacter aporrectodeae]MCW8164837.1 tricarballylate utilization 4Fe-4S protein TcuB [Verminephrobacter aporrectodeae subsp. tuberculatae]MCW8169131.1 tricarballylate utilization 4Fe-4S protein TcuB [Verminephrobacter aporrectodeae subsp. tuberculatae]MCW8208264.1 tricarballylate utilization 4Fe-4S protein TcuB [Verminephrobacter aporrectodeae subsp. tuberculatae]